MENCEIERSDNHINWPVTWEYQADEEDWLAPYYIGEVSYPKSYAPDIDAAAGSFSGMMVRRRWSRISMALFIAAIICYCLPTLVLLVLYSIPQQLPDNARKVVAFILILILGAALILTPATAIVFGMFARRYPTADAGFANADFALFHLNGSKPVEVTPTGLQLRSGVLTFPCVRGDELWGRAADAYDALRNGQARFDADVDEVRRTVVSSVTYLDQMIAEYCDDSLDARATTAVILAWMEYEYAHITSGDADRAGLSQVMDRVNALMAAAGAFVSDSSTDVLGKLAALRESARPFSS